MPVRGIGQHTVRCYAENNAVDTAGAHGVSAPAQWSMKIGQPTLIGLAFRRLVGLSCHRVRTRVVVPGRWTSVRRHGRRIRVRTPSRTKLEYVQRCHPRVVRRRTTVFVRVRQHGHVQVVKQTKIVRVVVPPHVVAAASQNVPFGHRATVSGWLGTSSWRALGGHVVKVLTAPANGMNSFSQAATAITAPDGSWTARLPAGPSRTVEAVYGGDSSTEGTFSAQVHVVVRARVRLSVTPRHVAWGGRVRLSGQLLGGYLPPAGALVRLRIGIGHIYQTYGVVRVGGGGSFSTNYTFGAGLPAVRRTYFFQIVTLPSGDYPYAPGASARPTVTVGGR